MTAVREVFVRAKLVKLSAGSPAASMTWDRPRRERFTSAIEASSEIRGVGAYRVEPGPWRDGELRCTLEATRTCRERRECDPSRDGIRSWSRRCTGRCPFETRRSASKTRVGGRAVITYRCGRLCDREKVRPNRCDHRADRGGKGPCAAPRRGHGEAISFREHAALGAAASELLATIRRPRVCSGAALAVTRSRSLAAASRCAPRMGRRRAPATRISDSLGSRC